MRVSVKLYATLRKYLPSESDEGGIVVELPDGATVADLIAQLRIPSDHAGIIVSNNEHLDKTAVLINGQEVNVFPPLAGGA